MNKMRARFEVFCKQNCGPHADSSDFYWKIFQAGANAASSQPQSQADLIPTERIVAGLNELETAANKNEWNGELAWISRAQRRLTGEDGYRPSCSATDERKAVVDELRELMLFLCGEARMVGLWFGEFNPAIRGEFWWRSRFVRPRIERALALLEQKG